MHFVLKLMRWFGKGQVKFWFPQVVGVPTQTPPRHWSLLVLMLKSVHAVPFAG
jgi:hypothetical protein